ASTNYDVSRSLTGLSLAMQFPDVNEMPPGNSNRLRNIRSLLGAFLRGDRIVTLRSDDPSPLQALNLMNNPFVMSRTNPVNSSTLEASVEMSDSELVTNLYLTVLSRYPTEAETTLAVGHLTSGDERTALARDLLWALFNKTEFYYNY
ncbi:MAG: DUF1553 domain-containing protein, partial [Chloroflexi bacterium]|nr:DUF1553 domain-containing protein [Chloroflexota bacterium]